MYCNLEIHLREENLTIYVRLYYIKYLKSFWNKKRLIEKLKLINKIQLQNVFLLFSF